MAAIQSFNTKIQFYKYLNGDLSLQQIEDFISQNLYLENELGTEIYIELLTFDYKDKNAASHLEAYLFDKVISEGEYETWKLTELLQSFIDNPQKAKELLDEFYHLYCGNYNREGEYVNGYQFLGHLGLNYFYWMDVAYIKTGLADNLLAEYNKYLSEIPFYHQQLKPIAERILKALLNKEIEILSKGKYSIAEELRQDLESDSIFQLKHPD